MLRIIPSKSATQAKAYFTDALSKGDYYTNDQELPGQFHGRISEKLGIAGPATKEAFFALVDNLHPVTGERLTPRTKDDRIAYWDFCISSCKSASILHALSNDNHILDAFQASVHETIEDIENDVMCRVRKGNISVDRAGSGLIWGAFPHQTARSVGNSLPDMQLHSHITIMNITYDETEGCYKAAKIRDIVRSKAYYDARFKKRYADRLVKLGYQVRLTANSFEVVGIDQRVIDHFSKRKTQVEEVAKAQGITDARALDALGAATRSKKQKGLSMDQLRTDWKRQLQQLSKEFDIDPDAHIRYGPQKPKEMLSAPQIISRAMSHCFERQSVTSERKLLAQAYRQALGDPSISIDDLTTRVLQDNRLVRVKQGEQNLCTMQSLLAEERRMIDLARSGVGKFKPLYTQMPALKLDGKQADAVSHILTTHNQVAIVLGSAGVGKTFLMKEAAKHIEAAGKKVFTCAPTSQATDILRKDGFDNTRTVASLLVDQQFQERIQGQIIWIDEAGLLGNSDCIKILELVKSKNARVIFGGDTRQCSAVLRGDALRVLNTIGGIRAAEVNKIRRQKDNPLYLDAVQDLALGNIESGFRKLDAMGAIKEAEPLNGKAELVNDYVAALKKKKSALIISPTHKEGKAITDAVRDRLKELGMIGKKELETFRYQNISLTEAEKHDCRSFQKDQIIQFQQNTKGIKRGSRWRVCDVTDWDVHIINGWGTTTKLPRDRAKDFSVYQVMPLNLAKGDKVMITQNGYDDRKKRLDNGTILNVVSAKDGKIVLRNATSKTKYTVDEKFGHLNHAHAITSYASQGKTVDQVLVWQSGGTLPATDAKSFYVSASRGKTEISIYTEDKAALLEHAAELGNRQSALELVNGFDQTNYLLQKHRNKGLSTPEKIINKTVPNPQTNKDRDHELHI